MGCSSSGWRGALRDNRVDTLRRLSAAPPCWRDGRQRELSVNKDDNEASAENREVE